MPALTTANNDIQRGRKYRRYFLSGQLFPDIAIGIISRIIAADPPEVVTEIGRIMNKDEDNKKLIAFMKFPENKITR
jgi:hypothetical protein